MAKTRKNVRTNRKKTDSKSSSTITLLCAVVIAVIAVIAGAFIYEKSKTPVPKMNIAKPPVSERHVMPPREEKPQVVHEDYSATIEHAPERHPRVKVSGPGTVAIIIDDMGKSVQEARSILDIDQSITLSIIPGLPKVRQVAEEAHRRGGEVMVHMPMEPEGYPEKPLELNGLFMRQGDDEITTRVEGYLREIPQAVGANNHMGSRFTVDREKMHSALGVLKGKGLFFVDSKTSPNSVGYDVAKEMGMRSGVRNVFLDNVQDVNAIAKQLRLTASMARKRGSAIAIGHPHSATIQALATVVPALKEEGITFVPVSRLVR